MSLWTHRAQVGLRRGLLAKSQASCDGSYALTCHLCNRPVSSEAVTETGNSWAVVLVKHHGAEATARFDLGRKVHWDDEARDPEAWKDLSRLTKNHKWFAPEEFAGGQAPAPPDDGLDFAHEK